MKKIILMMIFLSTIVSSFSVSYEDKTFQYSLRCCNETHCINLNSNLTGYTDLQTDYCYEVGGSKNLNYIGSITSNFILIAYLVGIIGVGAYLWKKLKS